MGCKACEQEAVEIYKEISKNTGVKYYKFISKKGSQIIVDENVAKGLTDKNLVEL